MHELKEGQEFTATKWHLIAVTGATSLYNFINLTFNPIQVRHQFVL